MELAELAGWTGEGRGVGTRPAVPVDAGFVVCDSHGRVVLCSSTAAELYGGTPTDLQRLTAGKLLVEVGFHSHETVYLTRNLAYLSNQGGWRLCNATTLDGNRLEVAVSVARFEVDHTPLFLLRLRRVCNA
jgi:PAS domain-containing protein